MRFFCLACALLLPLLSFTHKPIPNPSPREGSSASEVRHIDTARSYIGVVEKTGKNDGPEVEKFLKSVGRKKGDSWCAAFVSYCLEAAGAKEPKIRSGLARDFKRSKHLIDANDVLKGIKKVPEGSIFGWEKGNTIFGHLGFVNERWTGKSGITIEGNTSSREKGSQNNGDGVYVRKRSLQPASYFRIRWFVEVSYLKILPKK